MPPASPDSRALILDAAEARFAVQGFDSTTIKEIAGDARVNSALLYYYFADKEALYHDVVSRLLERMADEMAQAFVPGMAPDELLRAFILQQGRTLEANPRLRKLIGRELIDHDALHAQAAIRHLAASTFARLRGAIAAGQHAGLFRPDVDPRFAAISIVGQTAYFHFARPAVEILLNDGKALPAGTSEAFARHVADFTLAALAPKVKGSAMAGATPKVAPKVASKSASKSASKPRHEVRRPPHQETRCRALDARRARLQPAALRRPRSHRHPRVRRDRHRRDHRWSRRHRPRAGR